MITAAPQRRNAPKHFLPETKICSNVPPPDEAARLAALYQCNILDTPPEKEFDEIAQLAALICGTPIALISFIDSERQWFKSDVFFHLKTSIRRDVALCTHTIGQKDVLIVPDTSTDQRFASNPLVSDHNIKFYAGIPLITSDNQAIGTLCVIDHISRQLNSSQVDALRTLGCQVVKLLELRRKASEVKSTQIKQQSRRSRRFFTRFAAGCGLVSAILLGSGLVWKGSLTDSVYYNDWQQHYQVLGDLKDLQSTIQVSIANHYSTGRQANYIEPLDNINREIDLKIDQLKQKTINNPNVHRRLTSLEPLINRIQDGKTPKTKIIGDKQVSQLLLQQQAIAHKIEMIVGEEEKTQILQRSHTQANTHSSIFTFSAGFCLSFLILAGVYYYTDQSAGDRKHTQAAKKQLFTDPVLDTVGALIVVLDSQGKIIQINRFCEQIIGYTLASVKGKYFWELFSIPNQAQIAKNNLSNLLDGQTSNEYENFILTKDGDRRQIAWSNTTKRSLTGEVEYAITSGIDITTKTTSSVLGSSEQQLRVIDSLFTFVAVLTPAGILIEANQALLATAGLQPKDVIGLPLTQTYWWSYSTRVQTQMQTAIERVSLGECVRYDLKGRVGENQFITIDFALTPIFDATGKISYLIASGVDVTERQLVAAKRQQANEQLKDRLKELKQRNREISLLCKMNDVLQACLTVKEAYSCLAQLVQPLFPDLSGGIFIDQNNLLVSVTNWGSPVLAQMTTFIPPDCWAVRQGKPYLVDDTDNGYQSKHLHHTMPAESVCVPMIAQSTSAGVLYLFSQEKGSITPAKQQLAYTVAEQIALALANLKLRETLEHQSVRDPLTGLFNRRYMEESLFREMDRCDRKQQPLSLMMIDVDHFKRFNDTFGHDAGDKVLRELGKLLQRSVRACDIACRYGGEEFTLILPEASLSVTLERAEQIRDSVKQLDIDYCGQSLGMLTVSIGIACFPDCGQSGEALLKAADRALYQAKQQGRDRAIAATQS